MKSETALASTLRRVIALNLGMFAAEGAVAVTIGSVALMADSIDFLEDASVSLLVLAASAWSARMRARVGMGLAALLVAPTLAAMVMAWLRLRSGTPTQGAALAFTGLAALCVNAVCAWLLARHRAGGGSLIKAAYLSARNDTIANVAIIAAGALTAVTHRIWPDLVVGLGIGVLNAGAAWEVFDEARSEHRAA